MARVKVFTDRGWIEIPPPYTDIRVLEDERLQVTSISGFVSFWSTNEYLSEYGEYMDERTSRPKGEWIETKEKMPNDYDWVIAVVREIDTGCIWLPRVMEYRKGLNDWLFQSGQGWLSDEVNKGLEVVAWCPLPEPYTANVRGEG